MTSSISQPAGPVSTAGTLPLTIISQTSKTITFGWTPPLGIIGYVFYKDGVRVSNTFNATQSSVKFSYLAGALYRVDAVQVGPAHPARDRDRKLRA